MPTLNVYLHGRKVGTLDSDNGRLSFRYDQEYSMSATPEPLSFSLPIRKEAYPEEAIVPFFSNLLPDEGVRIRIAEILGLSPDNIFGLLQAIGEDCAGAVALFMPEKTPVEQGQGRSGHPEVSGFESSPCRSPNRKRNAFRPRPAPLELPAKHAVPSVSPLSAHQFQPRFAISPLTYCLYLFCYRSGIT